MDFDPLVTVRLVTNSAVTTCSCIAPSLSLSLSLRWRVYSSPSKFPAIHQKVVWTLRCFGNLESCLFSAFSIGQCEFLKTSGSGSLFCTSTVAIMILMMPFSRPVPKTTRALIPGDAGLIFVVPVCVYDIF